VRIPGTSQLVISANCSVSSAVLLELADRDVPVSLHGGSGWFYGTLVPAGGHNVLGRIAQHRAALDPAQALAIARRFVVGKIKNQRTLLRRNGEPPPGVLDAMTDLAEQAARAPDLPTLMGQEGMAARHYFATFGTMLRSDLRDAFEPEGRSRRPPRDPVNCLLSFGYAMLVRETVSALHAVGLDPYVGFLHQPRANRPALALDLMEEFRPLIVDSTVLTLLNTRNLDQGAFLRHPTSTALTPAGKRTFVRAMENRLSELITHPVFGTRFEYRRMLEMQARMLSRHLLGETPTYAEFTVR
jgi:CRISPR-associated endonuclease Cas1